MELEALCSCSRLGGFDFGQIFCVLGRFIDSLTIELEYLLDGLIVKTLAENASIFGRELWIRLDCVLHRPYGLKYHSQDKCRLDLQSASQKLLLQHQPAGSGSRWC